MKNKSYIGISFIILIFGIYAVPKIIDRFQNKKITEIDRLNVGSQMESSEDLLKVIGKVPVFSLTDQNNTNITNKEYLGKVYVVEFFFTSCPTICPIMNQNMLVLEKHFMTNPNFAIASITIDPETDTTEHLKEHAKLIGVSSPNWHFLTGDKSYIMNLSNKGFNLFAKENPSINGGFEHSGFFALVDKKGNIRSRKDEFGNPIVYYDGIEEAGIVALQQDIKVLLEE
jgi:protein SCO1/2